MLCFVVQSCPTPCNTMHCSLPSSSPHGDSPGSTGAGSLSLLHGIFLTQESNRGVLYRKQILYQLSYQGSPSVWWLSVKKSACECRRHQRHGFNPWVGKIPWSGKWQPALVFLRGKFHGQSILAGYSPWGRNELDTTVLAHTHTYTHTHSHTYSFEYNFTDCLTLCTVHHV